MTWEQLTLDRRKRIEKLYNIKGLPVAAIAADLGVHVSTIYRELKRGQTAFYNRYGLPEYNARAAEEHVRATRRRRKT